MLRNFARANETSNELFGSVPELLFSSTRSGNEYEDEGELNYDATFYRKYDAQVGRFTGVDMYAEKFSFINPYQFGGDNPVMSNDPSGALMTVEQFKQVRNYNKLGMEDKLDVGSCYDMPVNTLIL